jgi:nucleoside-diphosphate-sugar epimerase
MKIAVIGYGWLGLPLANKLLALGHHVVGTSTTEQKVEELRARGISAHQLQLPMKETSEAFLTDLQSVDWLVLTIPPSSIREAYAEELVQVVRLIPSTAHVIFTSSTSVYDDINQAVDESSLAVGNSPRGKTVYLAEQALQKELKHRVTVLRLGGLFGENRHPVKFMVGREVSEGLSPVNVAHLNTCIRAICAVIAKQVVGEIINICEEEHPTKKDFYTKAAHELGLTPPKFEHKIGPYKVVLTKKLQWLLNN